MKLATMAMPQRDDKIEAIERRPTDSVPPSVA